jgi:diadenosine tetraphosphate (Ap4A) HIT family hydrolase
MTCPFCNMPEDRIITADDLVYCIRDKYPVSPGHILIITRRHAPDFFELTDDERRAMQAMLIKMKRMLDAELNPQGYNVGINVGRSAGQTIDHAHLHLIPRFGGDMPDPKGGVRGVIPEKQKY